MSHLLDDLRDVAGALAPHELPSSSEVQNVVGAIVKVLANTGVTVAEDLIPEPVDRVVAPVIDAEVPAAESVATKELTALIERAEAAVAKLEGSEPKAAGEGDASAPTGTTSPAAAGPFGGGSSS